MSHSGDLHQQLSDLDHRGLRRQLRIVRGPSGRAVELDGRQVINFSSNDYLGLANHPSLVDAAREAMSTAGFGATASRLIVGTHSLHTALEHALADFHDRPSALLFNSGYNANVGTLQAIAGPGDVIFSDQLNHASLIDGCRLSRASTVVYPHNDVTALRRLMTEREPIRRFVVTDTVFSMDGDRARLSELATLCRDLGACLIIDEAHATGVIGPSGRGAAAEIGVQADVHIGTLGKAFGSFGAYVAGSRDLTEVLLNRARSFVFTTALPPSIAAASTAALALITGDEGRRRRARMASLITRFRDGLLALGLLAPGAGTTPIFPIAVGDVARVMESCERLLVRGIYAQGIRPPTVPQGTARLRFSLMATHTDADLEQALAGLSELVRAGWVPRSSESPA